MKKNKHSKYKNTGIIFELLTKQATAEILTNKPQISLNIIKRYFREGTELFKELACYHTLADNRNKKELAAYKLIELVLTQYNSIDQKTVNKEKYKLIGEIKDKYPINQFFEARLNNYRVYASIYKLFEYNNNQNPANQVHNYEVMLEYLTSKNNNSPTNIKPITSIYSEQPKDIQKIAFKMIIEKFNKKYKSLLPEQRKLISKFINENTALPEFKDYICKEVVNIQKKLKAIKTKLNDQVLTIKINEAIALSNEIISAKTIKDEYISAMVKYYSLINILK